MAAWQASFELTPTRSWPSDYRERLDAILPRATSWSTTLELWGDHEGTCVQVGLTNGAPDEGLLRIDMREPEPTRIAHLVEFCSSLSLALTDLSGKAVEPHLGEFMLALKGSPAFRFVEDPERFLRRLSIGGLEDS